LTEEAVLSYPTRQSAGATRPLFRQIYLMITAIGTCATWPRHSASADDAGFRQAGSPECVHKVFVCTEKLARRFIRKPARL